MSACKFSRVHEFQSQGALLLVNLVTCQLYASCILTFNLHLSKSLTDRQKVRISNIPFSENSVEIQIWTYCASLNITKERTSKVLPSIREEIMATLEEVSIDDEIDREILNLSTDDIINRTRLLENEIKVLIQYLLF